MTVTNPRAYLIIAIYNREKWNLVRKEDEAQSSLAKQGAEEKTLRDLAEDVAEKVFPEDYHLLPHLSPEKRAQLLARLEKGQSGPAQRRLDEKLEYLRSQLKGEPTNFPEYLSGMRVAGTFRSDIFEMLKKYENFPDLPMDEKDKILDDIYRDTPPRIPVGWMAVVDESTFGPFLEQMNGAKGVFWRIYDISILPLDAGWTNKHIEDIVSKYTNGSELNDDVTTHDVYDYMTPTNWRNNPPV